MQQMAMQWNRQSETELIGKVISQRFYNESSMFTVLHFEPDDKSQIPPYITTPVDHGVSARGILRVVHPGERFILRGKWINTKYGWTFEFNDFERDIPKTEEGIINFLSSGMFKGIGQKMAQRIVERFGMDTLEVIKQQPELLTEIKGLSSKKLAQLIEDYRRTTIYEEVMMKLQPFGLKPSKIVKIVDFYNEKAMKVIYENPYELCETIDGIGFLTADQIAEAMGIPANSQHRLKAATLYVMQEMCNSKGHVYLPLDKLQEAIVLTLHRTGRPVEQVEVAKVIADLLEEKKYLQMENDQSVYLSSMLYTEKSIATRLKRLLETPPMEFPRPMDELIAETEKDLSIQYADNQKEAFHSLTRSNVLVITGGPGTGKSTILKGIIRILKSCFNGIEIGLAAPTGKAAQRMMEITGVRAKTVHRLLGCIPNGKGWDPQYDYCQPLPYRVVVVDEMSMVDIHLMEMLVQALPKDCLFIMIGDVDQLPSVGPGSVLKDIIDSGVVPVTRLTQIFRQKDTSRIVINADLINKGIYQDIEFGHDFGRLETRGDKQTADAVVHCYKRCLAEGLTLKDIQVLTPFRQKTLTGANALNRRLQAEVNPPSLEKGEMVIGERIYRVGDPVMQLKNNPDKDIFNGSTGVIVEANQSNVVVKFDELDGPVNFEREEMNELILSYATTIHKSQGSEYDTVFLVFNMAHQRMLERRLAYTGVTRAKRRAAIIGEFEAFKRAILNEKSESRYTKLKERLQSK